MRLACHFSFYQPIFRKFFSQFEPARRCGKRRSQPGVVGRTVLERPSVKIRPRKLDPSKISCYTVLALPIWMSYKNCGFWGEGIDIVVSYKCPVDIYRIFPAIYSRCCECSWWVSVCLCFCPWTHNRCTSFCLEWRQRYVISTTAVSGSYTVQEWCKLYMHYSRAKRW